MRKVIVSMNITLDGFMSGPNYELDWHFQNWTSEMADSLYEELSKADTILLGRVTYTAMAKYWPFQSKDLSFAREDLAFAEMMNSYTKLVFSTTLARVAWSNSTLVKGKIEEEIIKRKQLEGKDMMVYGSGKFVTALINLDLVDEYQLWIHPVLIGHGTPLFRDLHHEIPMKLIKVNTFANGVTILYYNTFKKN